MTLQTGNRIPRNNFRFPFSGRAAKRALPHTGFTLIELVLVILLISVLTAVSTPLFRRTFSDIVLKNAAYDMAKMITYTGEMAIIEKAKYKLNLDFENGKYWITRYGLSEEGAVYGRVSGRYGKDYFLPRGLSLSGALNSVVFYPDGRADEAKITIRDTKGGDGSVLEIKGFGSRVKIEKLE